MGNSHQSRLSPDFHIPYGTRLAGQESSAGTDFGPVRMPSVKFQKGEMVMGRWPGSSLYYEVKVLGYETKSQLYTVIYKDGTELELREQDIKMRSRSRSRSRSPGRRHSRSRSPARSTRRSSSRTAAAVASAAITESAPSSRRDPKLRDAEVRLTSLSTENNSNNKHEKKAEKQKEENDTANRVNESESKVEAEPEKNQSRYNLRRRKDDGDAKTAEAKAEQLDEKDAKLAAAPAPSLSTPLDFGGKIGAYFWLLFLPAWVLFVILQGNLEDPSLANFPPPLPPLEAFWDAQALGLVILWILFQVLLYVLPVGKLSEGMALRSGERLKYRTNGFFAIVVSSLAVAAVVYYGVDLTYIHSNFLQLASASFLISVLLSVYLYVRSRYAAPAQLALGGNSGNVVYDFFKGRELNPRIKDFDLKFFCEMRPGLIGWCLINFAMALAEMKQQGLDAPSYSMILVNLFQLLYVVDGLWNEEAILDLMHDGFGFMLAFGDLVWVPFTYTLQAYYLVSHPNPLSLPAVAAIVTLKLGGFYIFRKSNSEKNAFRRNPSDPKLSHLKTIPTATGKSLLVSGWWGVVRHPNYLGDLIMALAWSIPCGFSHLLPWYYMVYFIILLVHRDSRDMSECRRKYGSAWDEYCRTVRYRIIPRVY
ncbi:delta(14)-sterol reductase LBR isoform X2 [Larimichthys crocea]|uniref:delta(14)-sterol reductase LBR isoform X2 n=1 Tax=Larimichthys crocea TaxID=215358 RepID=UPI0009010770|nr:lamin-B receptor isoform X2 [Larimichthys crocea]